MTLTCLQSLGLCGKPILFSWNVNVVYYYFWQRSHVCSLYFLQKINVCSFFFIFPENSMFCTVYSWIVLQNLFIVEVTRKVLEVTLEEGIHSHSCQTLVSSENGNSKPFKRYNHHLMNFAPWSRKGS